MRKITDRVVVMVTGSNVEPHDKNWKECERTWVPKLRELGYKVIIAVGNPDVGFVKTDEQKNNYFKFISENIIQFNTFDNKFGTFDKSIKLPIKWILENTDYDFYFRIDSDSFVHPKRFDKMIKENLQKFPDLDYMGCCLPWMGWNPHQHSREMVCRDRHFAAGCGYMISRKGMEIADKKMRIDEPVHFYVDDWVLGRAMWENRVPLLHDSRIYFESKHNVQINDFSKVGVPDITESDSHIAIQHYMKGKMDDAIKKLKL